MSGLVRYGFCQLVWYRVECSWNTGIVEIHRLFDTASACLEVVILRLSWEFSSKVCDLFFGRAPSQDGFAPCNTAP